MSRVCRARQPRHPGGGLLGRLVQHRCGREFAYRHGIPVPDPQPPGSGPKSNSSAGTGGSNGGGVNPNSPQFIAANRACQHYLPAGQGPSNSSGGGS